MAIPRRRSPSKASLLLRPDSPFTWGSGLSRRFAVTSANDPWGRVDADGTVYVRTAEGERVIGSWQAGSPEEALEFFRRKFQALETEVALLEQRMASTDVSPAQAQTTVQRLLAAVT